VTERLTTRDGRTLAYHRSGSGPTLVCHPGGPGFSSLYLADLAGLGDELELVLLEPRGTGGSTRPPTRRYDFEHYVADLEELRATSAWSGSTCSASRTAAMVAIAYAPRTRPGRRRSCWRDARAPGRGLAAEMERGLATRKTEPWYPDARAALDEDEAATSRRRGASEDLARQWPLYFGRYGEREQRIRRAARRASLRMRRARGFNSAVWQSFDLRPCARAHRRSRRSVSPASATSSHRRLAARRSRRASPTPRLVVLPGVGHFVFVEAPEAFREAVLSFLGRSARLIEPAVEALREGRPVVLPTDTVYGLCGDPTGEAPAREIYRLKQRPVESPLALLAEGCRHASSTSSPSLHEPRATLRGRTRSCCRTPRSVIAG
jgi:pimeloyl-ACP methyl ester carboxylesterase